MSANLKTLVVQEAFSNARIQVARKTLNYAVKELETEVVHVQDRLAFSALMEIVHLAQSFAQFYPITVHFISQ